MWLFRIFKNITDPYIGKTVIRFTTHGCMAQNQEFDYIGTIIGSYKRPDGSKMYEVVVLKKGSLDRRDVGFAMPLEHVPSWYLQNIGGDFLVTYD